MPIKGKREVYKYGKPPKAALMIKRAITAQKTIITGNYAPNVEITILEPDAKIARK